MKIRYALAYPASSNNASNDIDTHCEITKFDNTYTNDSNALNAEEGRRALAQRIKKETGFLPIGTLIILPADNGIHVLAHDFKDHKSIFNSANLSKESRTRLTQRFVLEYTAKDELAFLFTVEGWCTAEDKKKLKKLGLTVADIPERSEKLTTYVFGQEKEEKEI